MAIALSEDLRRIIDARHHDPFVVLGRHAFGKKERVTLFLPGVIKAVIEESGAELERLDATDLFVWEGAAGEQPDRYRVRATYTDGVEHIAYDPYCFPTVLEDFDLHLFGEGSHYHAYRFLGAHPCTVNEVGGVLFAVWAPNAERVSVTGNFNQWDGRRHPMRSRGATGVWELFIPGLGGDELYKYEIRNRKTGALLQKSDPYAQQSEMRPKTASRVRRKSDYSWDDKAWLQRREQGEWLKKPLSVYEVHLGSWHRDEDREGGFIGYRELAHQLVEYVSELGFTHIELLPVMEHPLDISWGYQTTGYFSPSSRFGSADDFRYFVDYCHRHDIGVLLDWAPGHFPRDAFALAEFDGAHLYEHADPRRGAHPDWGTLIFDYGRNEVKNFLLASAVYWLEEFHIDGLRVDAVASMLYLDYSREPHDWIPNIHGGNENLEAVAFLQQLNRVTHGEHPGTLMIAEESTAWPSVTRPLEIGGLGFSMKWNMGWMHDTLNYISEEPVHRSHHHNSLTFGMLYNYTENFVLPFSHDEVVHGKGSMIGKMPGDEWQRFANLRLLYSYMWAYPGKKLLFMGSEFAQEREWNCEKSLQWELLEQPKYHGVKRLMSDLNRLYREQPALHRLDFFAEGFDWVDCSDASQSVISFLRKSEDQTLLVVVNFTPVPRQGYRVGVSQGGTYRELLNSDAGLYGGSNMGNGGGVMAEPVEWMGQSHSLSLTLPPLSVLIMQPQEG
ncbi:MAG: 1,4-alpha-glucan branching protein GlgB [Candidatus Sedimenticola sp. (ex Thyasira tokunagai)]